MRLIVIMVMLAVTGGLVQGQNYRTLEDLKNLDGFVQKLEKGKIQPINSPQYIPADQAQIPDAAIVIGISMNGEARAYSLNLLNQYSVVNDRIGDTPFALLWGPFSNAAVVYDRRVDGKMLDFIASGAIFHNSLIVQDNQTDSFWPIPTGTACGGPLQGKTLSPLPIAMKTSFADWKKRHPNTVVLSVQGNTHTDRSPYTQILGSPKPLIKVKKPNHSLPPKAMVYAFNFGGKSYAISHPASLHGWQGKAGKDYVFFFRRGNVSPYHSTFAYHLGSLKLKKKKGVWTSKTHGAFNPETGAFSKSDLKVKPLAGLDTFWCVWSEHNKKTKLLNPPRRKHSEFEKPVAGRITDEEDLTKKGRQ